MEVPAQRRSPRATRACAMVYRPSRLVVMVENHDKDFVKMLWFLFILGEWMVFGCLMLDGWLID